MKGPFLAARASHPKMTIRNLLGAFVWILLSTSVFGGDQVNVPSSTSTPTIRLVEGREDPHFGSFEFLVGERILKQILSLPVSKLREVFPVCVGDNTDRPQILGDYTVQSGIVRFQPRYPVEPNLTHTARIRYSRIGPGGSESAPADIEHLLVFLETASARTTFVSAVYPSGEVPENLLRLYIHFSAAMSRGDAYQHICLLEADGAEVDQAFLELTPELWDVGTRRLTLLFDPGRIKRGLRPRADLGSALLAGKRYTLVVGDEMADAAGNLLKNAAEIPLSVVEADRASPDPTRWITRVPPSGSRDQLFVQLDESVDRALLERMLSIVDSGGDEVEGEATAGEGADSWIFVPDEAWHSGTYMLRADVLLEDRAGNRLDGLFDQEILDSTDTKSRDPFVFLPLTIE
jgi:hypothetical protein